MCITNSSCLRIFWGSKPLISVHLQAKNSLSLICSAKLYLLTSLDLWRNFGRNFNRKLKNKSRIKFCFHFIGIIYVLFTRYVPKMNVILFLLCIYECTFSSGCDHRGVWWRHIREAVPRRPLPPRHLADWIWHTVQHEHQWGR